MSVEVYSESNYQLITICREQKRGALDLEHIHQLKIAFETVDAPLVCLTGMGAAFCSGLDLAYLQGLDGRERQALNVEFGSMLKAFDQLPCPKVVFLNGPAVGGGCGFVFAADFVIAHPSSYFKCPEIDIGLLPAQIYPYIVKDMSQRNVKRWLWGHRIDLEESINCGVVHQVSEMSAHDWLEKNVQKAIRMITFMANMADESGDSLQARSRIFSPDEGL